jgi:quercetin dioxygenase-like cupin family protein
MMEEEMSVPQRAFWRGPEEGDNIWLLGGLYTFKARGSDNRDAYSLFEVQGPVATPRHLHEHEEEGFYVVEGKVTFLIGDQTIEATPGTFAFVPRGVEHAFKLESAEAKLLLLLTPGNAGHEDQFTEMGEPAGAHEVPPPPESPPDVEELAAIAARHGTRVVGPPLGMEG